MQRGGGVDVPARCEHGTSARDEAPGSVGGQQQVNGFALGRRHCPRALHDGRRSRGSGMPGEQCWSSQGERHGEDRKHDDKLEERVATGTVRHAGEDAPGADVRPVTCIAERLCVAMR